MGYETARGLVAQGYRVVLVSKDQDRLRAAAEAINQEFAAADADADGNADAMAHSHAIDFEATSPVALAAVQDSARRVLEEFGSRWGLP